MAKQVSNKGKYVPMVQVACPTGGTRWANPTRGKTSQEYRCTGCGQTGHSVVRA